MLPLLAAGVLVWAVLFGHPFESESYRLGYQVGHEAYAKPEDRQSWPLASAMGMTAERVCTLAAQGAASAGHKPDDPGEFVHGCVDAMHEYGMRP
jgi:hypothetical protein